MPPVGLEHPAKSLGNTHVSPEGEAKAEAVYGDSTQSGPVSGEVLAKVEAALQGVPEAIRAAVLALVKAAGG